MKEAMSYEEFLRRVKEGILTPSGNCPVTPLLLIFKGKWKNQVLYQFCINEKIRFGELKRNIEGISKNMLTSTLRELERDGLIQREQFDEKIPHVEYSFTEKGKDLLPVFYAMVNWGFAHEND